MITLSAVLYFFDRRVRVPLERTFSDAYVVANALAFVGSVE